jgi:hypothetical protein
VDLHSWLVENSKSLGIRVLANRLGELCRLSSSLRSRTHTLLLYSTYMFSVFLCICLFGGTRTLSGRCAVQQSQVKGFDKQLQTCEELSEAYDEKMIEMKRAVRCMNRELIFVGVILSPEKIDPHLSPQSLHK